MAIEKVESGVIKAQLKRTLTQPYTIALFTTLLAAVLGTLWFTPETRQSKPVAAIPSLNISVFDEAGQPVPRASLTLEGRQEAELSDAAGIIRFKAPEQGTFAAKVMAAGYRPEQLEVVVPRSDPNLTVVLKSLETKAMVVSQPYAEVRRSGPQPSGIGSNFSPWYELRSPPPKPGYELDPKTVQFSLSGDRRCNEWSECQIKQASANEVIFLFRLQGHNEWFPPRPAFSEGVLRVEFRPIDSSK